MDEGTRPRRLPVLVPVAPPARRHLPLAAESREVDRAHRPVLAVWEVTLRCDLACRHCGSRAGRERPDELTTDEALDLVRQMADLGVREVTNRLTMPDLPQLQETLLDAGIERTAAGWHQ